MKHLVLWIAVAGAVLLAVLPARAATFISGALGNGSRVGLPPHCDGHHVLIGNRCLQILCPPPKEPFNGRCVAPCPQGEQHTEPNGACAPSKALPR